MRLGIFAEWHHTGSSLVVGRSRTLLFAGSGLRLSRELGRGAVISAALALVDTDNEFLVVGGRLTKADLDNVGSFLQLLVHLVQVTLATDRHVVLSTADKL